jgi:hypothetical protein
VLEHAKIGVFLGSTVSAVVASLLLTAIGRRYPVAPVSAGPVDRDGDGWIDEAEVEDQLLAAVDAVEPHVPHPHVPHHRPPAGDRADGDG